MHGLRLRKEFIAQHYLIGKDFGAENKTHSHQYRFELEIENSQLDEFNFIIDILEVKLLINQLIAYFQDQILNELPEFENKNPSLELFSKILWQQFKKHLKSNRITVRLWEDDIAEASFREQ